MSDCDFCRIVAGKDPAALVVAEGSEWVAFFPDTPATHGHTLVVPRLHVGNIWEAPAPLVADLILAARSIGRVLSEVLDPEGLNLIHSAGSVAEQTVFHLHLHVVPRWNNDGIGDIWPSKREANRDTLQELCEVVRRKCRAL